MSERCLRTKYKLLTDGLVPETTSVLDVHSPRSPGAKGLWSAGLASKIMINKVQSCTLTII